MKKDVKYLKCVKCGKRYGVDEVLYTCSSCGNDGVLWFEYDYENIIIKEDRDFVRKWKEIFPFFNVNTLNFRTLFPSPLYKNENISKHLNLPYLYFKDDTRNPSGSFKDRASIFVLNNAIEQGYNKISLASTGNAASSMAAIGAAFGIKTYIFVPHTIPRPKLAQLVIYGAEIIMVEGNYDMAFDLSIEISKKFGWYIRNTGFNPYTVEGKKTVSLEILDQMGRPDWVFVPTGDGCILGGVYKGFYDIHKLGLINKMPRLVAVQAEGSAAIVKAYEKGAKFPEKVNAKTIADSISVDYPRNGIMALKGLYETKGMGITVTDEEILEAQENLGKLGGIFAEPASSSAFAGVVKAKKEGLIGENDKIVVLLTGNGLKDISSVNIEHIDTFRDKREIEEYFKNKGEEEK